MHLSHTWAFCDSRNSGSRSPLLTWLTSFGISLFGLSLLDFQTSSSQEADPKTAGAQIYQSQCADCHGEKGEGVDGVYDAPLRGVLTLFELENYISNTMPEGDAKACTGKDAKAVARYVYDQFYSIPAQNRLNPPKYLFSRLTNDQYRNSVVDILSTFLNRREERPREYGLKGTYFASRSQKKDKEVNQRIDSRIDFDFGEGAPKKVKEKEFAVRWRGSLIAEETGEYEIVVESANSVRLRLNSGRTPLVDANVVSGDRSEYKSSVFLLQGRLYNLSIDVSRFKEKYGFVKVSWIRPNGIREVIPPNNLCTNWSAPLPMLAAKFPPDDQSYGYPRGISISKEWTDSVAKVAIEVGQLVVKHFDTFVKPGKDPKRTRQAAMGFCEKVAQLAFRRPLTPELKKLYIDSQFSNKQLSLQESTKRSLVLILKSPRFLYVDLENGMDPPAFVLARVFWDSVPNKALLQAQSSQQLVDKKSIDRILDRMLADRRTQIKLENFFAHYLKLEGLHSLEKDEKLFAGFDKQLADDLEKSLRIQINQSVWNQPGNFQGLLENQVLFANDRMMKFYELAKPEGEIQKVGEYTRVPIGYGSGVLTHPLLMAGFAYNHASSPIHRGVFLAQNIVGRRMNPPPDTFPPFDGEVAKTWTTREKVSFQTKPISCQRCHGLINNLGFAFESYDAVGKRRTLDNQKRVDTTGQYRTEQGKLVQYDNEAELTGYLSGSADVHRHFVKELFQFLVKQPLAAYGPKATERLEKHFRENGFQIRSLVREIGKVAAFVPPNR